MDESVYRRTDNLKRLVEVLRIHHYRPVVVLIDEYDTALHNTMDRDVFPLSVDFFRRTFTSLFKNNDDVFKVVITVILNVGKGTMLYSLSNALVSMVFDDRGYGDCFGFT